MRAVNPLARILAAVLILASFGMVFLAWQNGGISYFNNFRLRLDAGFSETSNIVFFVLSILLALAALGGFFSAMNGKLGGVITYLVMAALCFVNYLRETGFVPSQMGIFAWLCPGLALLAIVIMFVPSN